MGATVAYMTVFIAKGMCPVILSERSEPKDLCTRTMRKPKFYCCYSTKILRCAQNDTHIASKTVTALFYTLFIIATFTFVYKNNHILYNIMLEYNVLWHKSTIYLI